MPPADRCPIFASRATQANGDGVPMPCAWATVDGAVVGDPSDIGTAVEAARASRANSSAPPPGGALLRDEHVLLRGGGPLEYVPVLTLYGQLLTPALLEWHEKARAVSVAIAFRATDCGAPPGTQTQHTTLVVSHELVS